MNHVYLKIEDIDFENYNEKSENTIEKNKDKEQVGGTKRSSKKDEKEIFKWEQLSDEWINKILSDHFVLKHYLGELTLEKALSNCCGKITRDNLRKNICKYINGLSNDLFFNIVEYFRREYDNKTFSESFDPYTIKNKRQLTLEIKKDSFKFNLHLVSLALNIDIIIFDADLNIKILNNDSEKIIMI